MEGDGGMVSKLNEKAQQFYKLALQTIKVQLKLNGTKFIVKRPKDNSKWKNVFGGSYSSDETLENDYEPEFSTVLIVNTGEMRDVWNRNRDTLESYTNDGSLNIGDELQYNRGDRVYRFKITQKYGFSELSDSLFIYTLMSIIETYQ